MRNLKCYVEFPFMSEWRMRRKIKSLPLGAGINVSWDDFEFSVPGGREYFPHGRKEGKHKLSLSIGIFYWSAEITFYTPK